MRGDRDDCHQRDRGFAADVRAVVGLAHGAALNFVDNCWLIGFTVVRRDALQSVWL